jgi:uncharacterized protein YndB with AHSA1/START domain
MTHDLLAQATITIDAPRAEVWTALTSPEAARVYMFGTDMQSDWRKGSPITWEGDWQGKHYKDKGRILDIERERLLRYSHFSPLSGQPDRPENYHTVTIELSDSESGTEIRLTQDNNPNEEARVHSEKNWGSMLATLKQYLEE